MNYNLRFLEYFRKQLENFDNKSKKIIHEKIEFIKQNPYRNKRVHSKTFSKAFRIRLNINKKELRMIYVVVEPDVVLVCFLDREKNYTDLEKYLRQLK